MTRFPGDAQAKLSLLTELDENRFPELVADILQFVKGHTEVRVVGGPGDGKRDVSSKNSAGAPSLTQCKYHRGKKSVSSQETDQIVTALQKFGASHGVFATTGRLSPQAKREYDYDFPGYQLEWMEGQDVVDAVLSNPLLSAVWFDGHKITEVRHRVAIPFLVRSLANDVPIRLDLNGQNVEIWPGCGLSFKKEWVSREEFTPYRQPKIRTLEEGWSSDLQVHLGEFRGRVEPHRTEELITLLIDRICGKVREICADPFALRVGRPHLTVLEGEDVGEYLTLPFDARTYICCPGRDPVLEREWVLPTEASGWLMPETWTAMMADAVRWYNSSIDCALNLQLDTPPGPHVYQELAEGLEYWELVWSRSYFLTGMRTDCEALMARLTDDERPSKTYEYGPAGYLLAWVERDYCPPHRPVQVDMGQGVNPLADWEEPFIQRYAQIVRNVKAQANGLGLTEVGGSTARHIAAATGEDPWPRTDIVRFKADELMGRDYFDIPSPILPNGRVFVFEKVFCVPALETDVAAATLQLNHAGDVDILLKSTTTETLVWVAVHAECPWHQSTDDFLTEFSVQFHNQIQDVLRCKWPETTSITRSFWLSEYWIWLGEESENPAERSAGSVMFWM